MLNSKAKIDAIFQLREAAERKAVAEMLAEKNPSVQHLDSLLDAQMSLEAKTQTAIEICHECGHEHGSGGCAEADEASAVSEGERRTQRGGSGNVIPLDEHRRRG